MSRTKLFIENFFVYGGINSINKIIPIVLLPILTRLLPDSEQFGIFDFYMLFVNFGVTLCQLGMYDAIFREYFEHEDPIVQKKVASSGLIIVFIMNIIITVIFLLFYNIFMDAINNPLPNSLKYFIPLSIFILSIKNMYSAISRIDNDRKIFFKSSLINSSVYYLLAIVVAYYFSATFWSLIIAFLISNFLVLSIFFLKNHSAFSLFFISKEKLKSLLFIGIPLMPVAIFQFLNDSVARYFILSYLDVSQLGIYSVGNKMAAVSSFIQTAFASGWYFFSFSTMKNNDQVIVNTKIFEMLMLLSFSFYFIIVPLAQPIFNLLYVNDFVTGYRVFQFLVLAPLLLILIITVTNQFLIIKKPIYALIPIVISFIVNVFLTKEMINEYNFISPAFSIVVGYLIAMLFVVIAGVYYHIFTINFKIIISFLLIILYTIFLLLSEFLINYYSIACIVIMILLYRSDVVLLFKKLIRMK